LSEGVAATGENLIFVRHTPVACTSQTIPIINYDRVVRIPYFTTVALDAAQCDTSATKLNAGHELEISQERKERERII
jgi:hypothetical protein